MASRFETSRGLAFAVTLSGGALGAAVFPALATAFIGHWGWRGAFLGLAAVWGGLDVAVRFFFHARSGHGAQTRQAGLGGQEKLDYKLARAREAVAGAKHSGSATLGTLEQTRPMVAAQALGIARALWNTPPSTPIAEKRSERRSMTGVPFERGEGSMSKLAASELAVRTTERAIQTMGGYGYIKDHPVQKWYRDAKLYTILEGTSEIERIVISNALGAADGKPPLHVDLDPRADRSTACSAGAPAAHAGRRVGPVDEGPPPGAHHGYGDESASASAQVTATAP